MPCETAKLLLSEGFTETCMSPVLADSARAFRGLIWVSGLGVEKHCLRGNVGMQTLWYLSRLKQRICFAFMPVVSNALKSKCRFQSADSEYKMLLVAL